MSQLELKTLEGPSSEKNKQTLNVDIDDDVIDSGIKFLSCFSDFVPPAPPLSTEKPETYEESREVVMMKEQISLMCTICNRTCLSVQGLARHRQVHGKAGKKRSREGKIDSLDDMITIKSRCRHHGDHRMVLDEPRGETLGCYQLSTQHLHGVAELVQACQGWPPVFIAPIAFGPPQGMVFPPSMLPPYYLDAGEGGFWPGTGVAFNSGTQPSVDQPTLLVAETSPCPEIISNVVPTSTSNSHKDEEEIRADTSIEPDLSLKI